MRTITLSFDSALAPSRVLEAAHDFTERRSDVFPAVEAEHFEVHSIGDEYADVTEGTGTGIGVKAGVGLCGGDRLERLHPGELLDHHGHRHAARVSGGDDMGAQLQAHEPRSPLR
jgi:hypothetical protein